ncbi:hypothetical protein CTAYLR_006053 [Chrysophaeum taylorii]|uniref:Uncharacterized protein n=1 Tax=Chrysophaeum taylorii TaxID=2483200 RepID=A0AAD7XPS0_9STRA|nr:hypothetical protein CTAYLR_006053 [Chrysophaeum taylorii]
MPLASASVVAAVAEKVQRSTEKRVFVGWRREKDTDCTRYGSFEYRCAPSGKILRIDESYSSTGTRVWDTAVAMSRLFEKRGVRGTILELGAGTGLLGMALSARGADRVVLTELGAVVPHLEKTVERNALGNVRVAELDWTDGDLEEFRGFDLVVASDVLICEQWAVALARVLVVLRTETYVGTARGRDGVGYFLRAVEPAFEVSALPPDAFHPDFACPDILVFHLAPRSSSST